MLGLAGRGDRVEGLAACDPAFWAPFATDGLDAARAALVAARPHTRHDVLTLVVEDLPRPV